MTMEVLVFKTDLTWQRQSLLADSLSSLVGLLRWSVDWEDCDRVLRIEGDDLPSKAVIEQLRHAKIRCEELR